jgi:hypothetical protein
MKMKFTLAFSLLTAIAAHAGTITLNNNNPSAGQYTSFSDAQSAANAGDTILVQPSTINYGDISISKRLIIIGPGHNPSDKQNSQKAFFNIVNFSNVAASDGEFNGFEVYQVNVSAGSMTGVKIKLCKITNYIYISNFYNDSWVIDGCVFTKQADNNINGGGYPTANWIIQNCLFNGYVYSMTSAYTNINNCVFINTDGTSGIVSCTNVYANNCIFYKASFPSSGVSFSKCLSYLQSGSPTFPNGTNYDNTDPQFVNVPASGANFSYAYDFHLLSTSPVLNGGTDGTDIGLYGGNGDFDLNGVPRNPYIKTFNVTGPTTINSGDPLNIYIKAKVRN